jgi:hypothetical protein
MEPLLQWHDHLPFLIRWTLDLFWSGVIVRGIFAKKLSTIVEDAAKRLLVRGEHDMAYMLHYYNRALNKGHTHVQQANCDDGACRFN